jgi:hypothetical protein
MPTQTKPSIVFAHGIWADGSSSMDRIAASPPTGVES